MWPRGSQPGRAAEFENIGGNVVAASCPVETGPTVLVATALNMRYQLKLGDKYTSLAKVRRS